MFAERGEGIGVSLVEHAKAVLYNGLGQYEQALAAAERASDYPPELGHGNWSLVELIEAAARSGQPGRGADALTRLVSTTGPSGMGWARGVESRSRALLTDGEEAEHLYVESIDRLARTHGAVGLARARLLYSDWLRRKGRRRDARDQLRRTREMLVSIGAEALRPAGASRHRGEGSKARRRDAGRPHPTGDADRADGGRGTVEPGDRCAAVH